MKSKKMKKINSIWFGPRALLIAGIFVLVIPAFLYILDMFAFRKDVLMYAIKASFTIGIVIILLFSIILFIELKQDKNINKKYNKEKYRKIEISKNIFECQYCGDRKVQEEDSYCKACGIKFTLDNKNYKE
jgi:Ca2+/H+ antiporter